MNNQTNSQYQTWVQEMRKDPSMLPIFRSKLKELNDLLNDYKKSLDKMFRIKVKYPVDENKWDLRSMYGRLFMVMIKHKQNKIKKVESEIRRFVWLKDIASGKERKANLNIEQARMHPIGNIMPTPPTGKGTNRVFYKCCLHIEKTGSFVWFKDKNKFKCFGCGEGGSVIDLYMKLYGVDFKEAVKFLQNY